jgi:AcrR family transcriptional regulator
VSLARYGVAKTTLEDVAKEAGCARATVYRYFGGKQQLLRRCSTSSRPRARGGARLGASRHEPRDALVAMGTTAAHELLEHDALQFVLAHEPELVLPWITFDGRTGVIASTAARSRRPSLRFLPPRMPLAPRSGASGSSSRTSGPKTAPSP